MRPLFAALQFVCIRILARPQRVAHAFRVGGQLFRAVLPEVPRGERDRAGRCLQPQQWRRSKPGAAIAPAVPTHGLRDAPVTIDVSGPIPALAATRFLVERERQGNTSKGLSHVHRTRRRRYAILGRKAERERDVLEQQRARVAEFPMATGMFSLARIPESDGHLHHRQVGVHGDLPLDVREGPAGIHVLPARANQRVRRTLAFHPHAVHRHAESPPLLPPSASARCARRRRPRGHRWSRPAPAIGRPIPG